MDLIYMNDAMEDVGVLHGYALDLEFGDDMNSFECTVNVSDHCCKTGWYLYMEGTEYGGIIDKITSDTGAGEVTYSGRTWHGILESKILEPDAGQDYLTTVAGNAYTRITSLLSRMGLTGLFAVSSESSGVTLKSWKCPRYIGGYDAVKRLLSTAGCKLQMQFTGGKVVLSAVPKVDYTETEIDSDLFDFRVTHTGQAVNHLICLGSGELADRMVVHLYADADGNISQTKTFSGMAEYTAVYDYPAAESEDELISGGEERLKELRGNDSIQIDLPTDATRYDVGDTLTAIDHVTGVTATAEVKRKIVTMKFGHTFITYKVGD